MHEIDLKHLLPKLETTCIVILLMNTFKKNKEARISIKHMQQAFSHFRLWYLVIQIKSNQIKIGTQKRPFVVVDELEFSTIQTSV